MLNKIICLFCGLGFCFVGIEIIFSGGTWDKYHHVFTDLGEYNIHIGSIVIAIGLFFIIFSIVGKWQTQKSFICPKCEESVIQTGNKEINCPICDTKMEPLEDFYKRYPDKV